ADTETSSRKGCRRSSNSSRSNTRTGSRRRRTGRRTRRSRIVQPFTTEAQPMMRSRLLGGGAAAVLVGFAVLATPTSARQPSKGKKLPDTVKLEADVRYAGKKNKRQQLNLLLPRKPKDDKPLPVIVYVHGGAWLAGDRAGGHGKLAGYVADGEYAGVSVGYRLTGEAIWPAQIHDCKAAIRWVRANAKKYNLDPDRIGVVGDSAGGHLVAMLRPSRRLQQPRAALRPP